MADPYIGEIRMFASGTIPQGWAACDGKIMPINQNQSLFAILGNRYGGDGKTTFALPNLSGRVPIHTGGTIPLGEIGGEESHTLSSNEMPSHSHIVMASNKAATEVSPDTTVWGSMPSTYSPQSNVAMSAESVQQSGGNMAHSNMQPYVAINFCIALTGEFPPRD